MRQRQYQRVTIRDHDYSVWEGILNIPRCLHKYGKSTARSGVQRPATCSAFQGAEMQRTILRRPRCLTVTLSSKEAWRKGSQSVHIESPGDDPQREPVKPIAGLAAIACTGRFHRDKRSFGFGDLSCLHRPREGKVPIAVGWTSESYTTATLILEGFA